MTISVTGFFISSAVGVDTESKTAGIFSLSSDEKTGFLIGESLNLRFSIFEATCEIC